MDAQEQRYMYDLLSPETFGDVFVCFFFFLYKLKYKVFFFLYSVFILLLISEAEGLLNLPTF